MTVKKELPVTWSDGTTARLPVGTELLPKGTDGESVTFETRDRRTGTIHSELRRDAETQLLNWYIEDTPESEYFDRLPFAG